MESIKQTTTKSPIDSLWWLDLPKEAKGFDYKSEKHKKLLNKINARFDYMKNNQGRLVITAEANEQLYKNNDYFEFFERYRDYIPTDYVHRLSNYGDPRTILNVYRSCVNAAQNKIAKINPVVTLNTKLFSPLRRDKVMHCQDDVQDWMQRENIYKDGQQAFFNTNVAELGYIKVMPKPKNQNYEFGSPNPLSIYVEHPYEGARYRSEIWEFGYVEKYEIEEKFGVKLKAEYSKDDRILLMEAFKANYAHVIATDKEIILLETWDYEIPYFEYRWSPALRGFATFGLISEVKPIQNSLNNLMADIESSFRLMGRPKWMVENASQVSRNDLINTLSAIVFYNKTPPEAIQPKPINEAYFQWVETFIQYAYQLSGVSEIYASGEIPSRLEARSGETLEAYDAIRSDRFQIPSQNYEDLFKRVAGFMLNYAARNWKKSQYTELQVKEARAWTSMLQSEHPAGQHKQAEKLLTAGLITRDQYFQAIQYNNLEQVISNDTMGRMAIEKKLTEMIETGVYFTPDYQLGYEPQLQIASRLYKQGIYQGLEEEKLDLISDFIDNVKEKIKAEIQKNPPPPPVEVNKNLPPPPPTLEPPQPAA